MHEILIKNTEQKHFYKSAQIIVDKIEQPLYN